MEQATPARSKRRTQANEDPLEKCKQIILKIGDLEDAEPFMSPVDPDALGIPDYFTVIKHPMDLGTILQSLDSGNKYQNAYEVLQDVQQVWKNCRKYNGRGHPILKILKSVESKFDDLWDAADLPTEPPKPSKKNPAGKQAEFQQEKQKEPKTDDKTSKKRPRSVKQELQQPDSKQDQLDGMKLEQNLTKSQEQSFEAPVAAKQAEEEEELSDDIPEEEEKEVEENNSSNNEDNDGALDESEKDADDLKESEMEDEADNEDKLKTPENDEKGEEMEQEEDNSRTTLTVEKEERPRVGVPGHREDCACVVCKGLQRTAERFRQYGGNIPKAELDKLRRYQRRKELRHEQKRAEAEKESAMAETAALWKPNPPRGALRELQSLMAQGGLVSRLDDPAMIGTVQRQLDFCDEEIPEEVAKYPKIIRPLKKVRPEVFEIGSFFFSFSHGGMEGGARERKESTLDASQPGSCLVTALDVEKCASDLMNRKS